jgi:hypothetical protein
MRMRRPLRTAALARHCAPPWRPWRRGGLARAERTADGRVHLVVVRSTSTGIVLTATGVGAADAESLAPIAARVRRALRDGAASTPRGTSAFEDAALGLLAAADPGAIPRLLALGHRCPVAPALRTMPEPAALAAMPAASLARRLRSAPLARRIQALARAFVAGTPPSPSVS